MAFRATRISKSYGRREVLRDVSIAVEPQGLTVLLGPSGCGKSTLLRSMSMLEPPDTGQVEIDGVSYSFPTKANSRQVPPWPRVTVVFQQHFLWPHMTIRENILLPARRFKGHEDRVRALTESFDMTSSLDKFPNEASVGQRQRAALIRGLALCPEYILLDEITAALDVEQTCKILRYFLDGGGQDVGILIVTHLLGFARRLIAVRGQGAVYFMDQAAIVEQGDETILQEPRTERLKTFMDAGRLIA
jgi:arginine transport system ATP-binding protein